MSNLPPKQLSISTDELHYKQCARCVMDTTAKNISFDADGICNFCSEFLKRSSHIINESSEDRKFRLDSLVSKVKASGNCKPYDCIVGVSGGVDSSWALVKAVELGLRPLAVHMDNGWNSELAQNNIFNLVKGLKVDLYTYVIDWTEYRSLMQAFFDSDVIDIELLYDNAMLSVCYRQAKKFGLRYILAGSNQATEGMAMPCGWNWYKHDALNIRAIAKRFGNVKIKTFPTFSTLDFIGYEFIRKIHWISFLDFFPYNKLKALDCLEKSLGYRRYPFKHYESIFTRFYQGYILPHKFGVDKRLLHLGTLVASGQLIRDEALVMLKGIAYPSQEDLDSDMLYFIKKMGWREKDFETYITRPEVPHNTFFSESSLYNLSRRLIHPTFRPWIKNWLNR